ncbi:hypothetical protein MMC32_003325 [Xylographa parallela]|nr:hypothetical protein [Xylographa parallela]
MALNLPTVPGFHHTTPAERNLLSELPIAFNFHPTWGNVVGTAFQNDCAELMSRLPIGGIFTPTQPRIVSYGNCFIGVYVTAPLARRRGPVSDSWTVIQTWLLGAMLLYAGSVPAGWSLDLRSGIQICAWQGQLLNLAIDRPMPPVLRSANGDLASGLTNLATERGASGAAFTALLFDMHTYPALNAPTGVPHVEPTWAAQPGIPVEDCQFLIRSFWMADWFLHSGGIFLRTPVVMRNRRCAFAMFFSVPPEDGRGRLAAPTGIPSMYHQTWALMLEAVHRHHGQGGYMDLGNGLQIALYETSVTDPMYLCSLITKISLRQCFENNIRIGGHFGGLLPASRPARSVSISGSAIGPAGSVVVSGSASHAAEPVVTSVSSPAGPVAISGSSTHPTGPVTT